MKERELRSQRRGAEAEPAKTPYLHLRIVESLLLGEAVAITGNAKASSSSAPRSTTR